uniref:Response regulatory domain-containing protein n=1 Tax=Palpitomonas bilix TaxID=652834 RepID=A0A7S3GMH2_9EUKA|mmetsp:Transcript_9636/g.25962  ORF Transcript_9636/g.25962 Transcript_9636/m.25962 type:complete len:240 (+) Transcript_9636:215-934(+)
MLQSFAELQQCRIEAFDDGDALLHHVGIEVGSYLSGGDLTESGEEGTARQRERTAQALSNVVLMVVDGQMERIGGVEVVKRLQAGGFELGFPCIAASGATSDEDKERFKNAGLHTILVKPFNKVSLHAALTEAGFAASLDRWRNVQSGRKSRGSFNLERKDDEGAVVVSDSAPAKGSMGHGSMQDQATSRPGMVSSSGSKSSHHLEHTTQRPERSPSWLSSRHAGGATVVHNPAASHQL